MKTDILSLKLTVDISLLFNGKTIFVANSCFHITLLEEVVGVVGQQFQQTFRGKISEIRLEPKETNE